MGRDPELSTRHPSVIINGRQYHYGHHPDPQYDYYLVEHANYGKDYWSFKEKDDLVAFLVNLPESADRDRRRKLHPDWRDVSDEQRTAYIEEDRAALRATAAEKLEAGTAQIFNMDLDGKNGPYPPQHIQADDREVPIERVARQLRDHKENRMHGLSEAGKLRLIEGEIDWTGVSDDEKKKILSREVNFARITPEQFKFVYEDIEFDKIEPAEPAVAQALFDQSRSQPGPRTNGSIAAETAIENPSVADNAGPKRWDAEQREAKYRELFDTSNRVAFAEFLKKSSFDLEVMLNTSSQVREAYFRQAETTWDAFREMLGFHTDVEIQETLDVVKAKESELGAEQPKTLMDLLQAGGLFPGLVVPAASEFGNSQPIRDTTRNLVESMWLDAWPRNAAIVDFGLKSQAHYEAIYYPLREEEITPQALDAAMASGEKLTALVRSAKSNPHRDITFHTDWDGLMPEPESGPVQEADNHTPRETTDANGRTPRLQSPSEIARDATQNKQQEQQEKSQETQRVKDDGNGR